MIRKLSVIFITMGLLLVLWNGYPWWLQSQVVTEAPGNSMVSEQSYPMDYVYAETYEGSGELTVPKLGKKYPVDYDSDRDTLKKGIGMFDTSFASLPSEGGHTALAGHSETTFAGLNGLVEGDFIYLTENNIEYEYQINKIWVADSEDTSFLVPTSSPTLTFTTCYPFDLTRSAPERFIVQADLVKQQEIQ
ncbi:class D sortase [Halobacillus sp. GSS1]|uniref:class D sortase n=1 Tax=Halobacillus sp. GSS1 TaxID=2815919 RepID=UPI001A904B74|nr:class D sortase [Halobacillus sp. GSS1]MBN9654882.1 class D sortase [Halobacillus sp. GSS1]